MASEIATRLFIDCLNVLIGFSVFGQINKFSCASKSGNLFFPRNEVNSAFRYRYAILDSITLAKGAITESTEAGDLKFDVFEIINQSNFLICFLGLFHHSQGVNTERRRPAQILKTIPGKSAKA
jgi:hypothetical protein